MPDGFTSRESAESATPSGLDRPVLVTFFPDEFAKTKHEEPYTLRSLASRIRTVTARRKEDLPWLKLARFGGTASGGGSLRHDANVLRISGIEVDYGKEKMPIADAVEILAKADVLALVYASPSHTENKPRWRVLCPTSTVQEIRPLHALEALARRVAALAPSAKDPERYFVEKFSIVAELRRLARALGAV